VSIRAIIPLKALATAKGRLSPALDASERQALVAWMATHVIRTCLSCDAIDDVLVVAGDEPAAEVARRAGAPVLVVHEPGLAKALTVADAASATCAATVVVAADLPDLTVADLTAVVAAAAQIDGPAVVVAATHDGGTGALLRRPPTVVSTAYGTGSATRHLVMAREAAVTAVSVTRDGLAHDVDTPDQLSPALAGRRGHVVVCASPKRPTEESACRKAP
jgi:2-phospho-L-lactate/phosphoenolpyruvate guanylyltransferase